MILSNDNKYKGEVGRSLKLNERTHVEEPFLHQLEGLGWKVIRLESKQEAKDSFRSTFSEVILIPELRASLKKINSFLTDSQVDEVVKKITTFDRQNLIENNQKVLELLLEKTTVSMNELTGEVSPTGQCNMNSANIKKGIILSGLNNSLKGRKENYTHEEFIKEVKKSH